MNKTIFIFLFLTIIISSSCVSVQPIEPRKVQVIEFKIDKYEVTNKEFAECVKDRGCSEPHYTTGLCVVYEDGKWIKKDAPFELREDNKPVACVTFTQAQQYCNWAGKRLPTEEEWEYVAKSGELYSFSGSNNLNEVSWNANNSDLTSHEVGLKKPNAFGVYDMTGNVWEWVSNGILRGASWKNSERYSKISARKAGKINSLSVLIGFRCAY